MDLSENFKESLRSIQSNKLRSILTALIITVGITALVGILSAVDAIQANINTSFSNLGANSFKIERLYEEGNNNWGRTAKNSPAIKYEEVQQFLKAYDGPGKASGFAFITWNAKVKHGNKVTNPNIRVRCGDINFVQVEGYKIEKGRNFSEFEMQNATPVAIIGDEIYKTLFAEGENPINQDLNFFGTRFKIIGLFEKQGTMGGGGSSDRTIVIPLETGRNFMTNDDAVFQIRVGVHDPTKMEHEIGEATGLMRAIRGDKPGTPNSFAIERNISMAEELGNMTGYLKIGGVIISIFTLLGASIGLMNIMMVTVTERTREIGIRKALGATPKEIMRQFLTEAIVICQLGGFGGLILGIIVGNALSNIVLSGSFVTPWFWMILAMMVGTVVGIISGYIPARKAAKVDPIESLRYE